MFNGLFGKPPAIKPSPVYIKEYVETESDRLNKEKKLNLIENHTELMKHQLTYKDALMNEKECDCGTCKHLFKGLNRGEKMRELLSYSLSCVSKPERDIDTISISRDTIKVENLEQCKEAISKIKNMNKERHVIVLKSINGVPSSLRSIVREHHNNIPIIKSQYTKSQKQSNI